MSITSTWNKEAFQSALMADFEAFTQTLATDAGDWVIKGFIDVYRNVYTISVDTKVVSKLIELMLIPLIVQFAQRYGYELILSEHQKPLSRCKSGNFRWRTDCSRFEEYLPHQPPNRQWIYFGCVYRLFP